MEYLGGGGGNLSVACGKQQVITSTTVTGTRLSEIGSSPEVSSLKATSTTNDQYIYSFTTQSTTWVSEIETSEASSIKSTSTRNEIANYTIATVITERHPEIESSSAVSLIKSTSTRYERDTHSVTSPTTLLVAPDSLLKNTCGEAYKIFYYDWYRHARIKDFFYSGKGPRNNSSCR